MRKLVLAGVLIAAAYGIAKLYVHYRVSDSVDDLVLMMSPMADVQYGGVSSTMGGTLSIEDVEVNVHGYAGMVSIDKLSVMTPSFLHLLRLGDIRGNVTGREMPESLAFGISGFRTPLDSELVDALYMLGQQAQDEAMDTGSAATCTGRNGFSPSLLRRMGYNELVSDVQVGYRTDEDAFVVQSATAVEDMYTMHFEISLEGAFPPQAIAAGRFRPRLVSARLEYTDLSLDRRISELCADRGLSADDIRRAKLETFTALGTDLGIVFDDQIIQPFQEFLDGKSTLVLSADPIEPVNLSQIGLYKDSDIPALLNLTAAAR